MSTRNHNVQILPARRRGRSRSGTAGQSLDGVLDLEEFQTRARTRLPNAIHCYVANGSEDESGAGHQPRRVP